jgi:Putative transposase of IS4/5 family (DUF4096)
VRRAGAGRPAKPPRLVFEAIVSVLRTGCQWKAIPSELFGSANAVHQKFAQWSKAMFKAPLAQGAVGRNPTDRGKKQASSADGRALRPLVARRDRVQAARRDAALGGIQCRYGQVCLSVQAARQAPVF